MFNEENGHEKWPTLITFGLFILITLLQVVLILLKAFNLINIDWWVAFLPIILVIAIPCAVMFVIFLVCNIISWFVKKD